MRRYSATGVIIATTGVGLGLLVVGWFDYRATRAELLSLLRQQAVSLREIVVAAARSNEAAASAARSQVTERLLDNARLLAELDRRGALTGTLLDRVAGANRLFRAGVFSPDGRLEITSGGPGQPGGRGQPPPGRGFGSAALLGPLLRGEANESVSDLHSPRWGGGARIAAGVRRANGGAITLTVDASEVASLERQTSLDGLVREIASSTGDLAYVVIEGPEFRYAHGEVPPASGRTPIHAGGGPPATSPPLASPPPTDSPAANPQSTKPPSPAMTEREFEIDGRPVIEFAGPAGITGGASDAVLRLGLRLDAIRRTERRMLSHLAASLAAALALSALAFGTVWLWQKYGALSRRHALAEAALKRRDRLSAMGELASTVAHEVRNPLNAIAMSGQRLRREFLPALPALDEPDRAELQQLLAVVEGETGRINRIVQQFLDYARPPKLAPRPSALGPWLEDIVGAARPMAAARAVSLTLEAGQAGEAVIDPDQLRQAVDNLLRNAIEATPPGGSVSVHAYSDGRGHTIAIRDTGSGIEPEHLSKIFDLYFTTKADGTGVGLAVSQQIVTGHDGTIEVDSAPGRGTTMRIRLPRTMEA
ncbi:MAG: PAS domain-containing sensor histidine kinase [Vicinamibacterales bacterium]